MTNRERESKPWQFSLRTLMVAVTLVAIACGAAGRVVKVWNSPVWGVVDFLTVHSIPVLLCSAVGILHRRFESWMAVGGLIGSLILLRLLFLYLAL